MGETLKRIKQYIDFKGISLRSLERSSGLSNGAFAAQLKRNGSIGVDKLENILQNFDDLNPTWALTGKGEMITTTQNENEMNEPTVRYLARHPEGVPLIPATAVAGYGNEAVSIKEHDILERYIVPDFRGADFMIHVAGNSMQPKYSSGDIIACQVVNERHFFQWGRVFVLHHKHQGIMVKRLFPAPDQGQVICRSDNPDYPEFTLNLDEITNIAMVLGAICVD